jgi:hypothetical protein
MEDGVLRFRTLFETTIDEIAQSPELERIMQVAADNCAVDDAFFSDPEPEPDTWCSRLKRRFWPAVEWRQALELLHLGILNTLSARYSEGHFGHALLGMTTPSGERKHKNMSIVTECFCFGLTCEKNEAVRARKIRVMIAAKDFLKHQVDEKAPKPEFERRGHWVRWETMLQMKRHMESEEAAAAMNKPVCRKIWELSLSFLIPRASDSDDKVDFVDQLGSLCQQLQGFEDSLKVGGTRPVAADPRKPRGAAACGWRAGSESLDRESLDDPREMGIRRSATTGFHGGETKPSVQESFDLGKDSDRHVVSPCLSNGAPFGGKSHGQRSKSKGLSRGFTMTH